MRPILSSSGGRVNGGRRARPVAALGLGLLGLGCGPGTPAVVEDWNDASDRTWVGPEFWANRLQDWRVSGGRLEGFGAIPMRTAHLLTARVEAESGDLRAAVRLGTLVAGAVGEGRRTDGVTNSAGLLLGSGPDLDYRAASLVHHSWGRGGGLFAGVDGSGRIFVRDFESEDGWLARPDSTVPALDVSGEIRLEVHATAASDPARVSVELSAEDGRGRSARLRLDDIPASRLAGNLALVADIVDPASPGFWFDDLRVGGGRVTPRPGRALGPVAGVQHTLSRGTLKLTAQLFPLGTSDAPGARLEAMTDAGWEVVDTAAIVEPGFTATFRVEDWPDSLDVRVRVVHPAGAPFEALVPTDPVNGDEVVVAAFTGNHNVAKPVPGRWSGVDGGWFPWDRGVWFPHADIVRHVAAHEPDLLFFSGDQVYEGASPTAPDREQPYLDYLYRWYLWHWAFGDLTRRLPSVTIPDDHDVYHGNLWGAGGIATPAGLTGTVAQDAGGYRMPAEFVRMVERTQTSHLPDPVDPVAVEQDIGVYFTEVLYGGVSFAILEDRKFKSAPGPLLPGAGIVNGWARNPRFDPARESDVTGAVLLGERQLRFLDDWAADWTGGTWMKVALSQTLLANLATLPDSEISDANVPTLRIMEPGEYPETDRPVADMDSNGWPRSGRDRALRALRRGFAVHLAGDQHLGSTLQYGVDEWEDAAFALCVPSIANFFPRRWFPPRDGDEPDETPGYTGRFLDGFGNRMTVHAVSNPVRGGRDPAELHDLAPGYGIARFERAGRRVRLEAWPRWADPSAGDPPYPGWPVEFDQLDGYGGATRRWLPELVVRNMEDPVVRVTDSRSGEVLYTLRIRGTRFSAPVVGDGPFTVGVGEPGTDRWTAVDGLRPGPDGSGRAVEVVVPPQSATRQPASR